MGSGGDIRRGTSRLWKPAAWVLLAGLLYLYVAVCATDDDAHAPSPESLVHVATSALPPSGDHHGDTEGCGALIHDPGCFVVGDFFAGVQQLVALCALLLCLALIARGKARNRPARVVVRGYPPPARVRGGRGVLLSVCVSRT
ncbi:hypothetical protein [Saccharothrix australiensis]|uniref:hypothetical protein n=1 Tax=Saccharothrix australiensis TaxID=2072 RepID=UPI0011C3D402|nr:hypothetical protein [Saccharothrix australiensis]